MKKEWKHPRLEVLDVSMTMKHNAGAEEPPEEPIEGEDRLDS